MIPSCTYSGSSGGSQFFDGHPTDRASGGHGTERVGSHPAGGPGNGQCPVAVSDRRERPDVQAETVLPAGQPARPAPGGPAGADGAPDDDVGGHVGRQPRGRRRRDPARQRPGPLGHRLRLARQGRGRDAAHAGRPHCRARSGHRHGEGRGRAGRAPGRVLARRDVVLPGSGIPAFEEPRQHRDLRLAGRHAGRAADGLAAEPGARHRRFHGRSRLHPLEYPKLVGAHRVSD